MVDIGAMVQGTAGIVQGIHGLIQRSKGRDMMDELSDTPEYQNPEERLENVRTAERLALQGLPEEQKLQYLERMQQSQAGRLGAMKTLSSGLRGMSAIGQEQREMNKNLLSMDAQARYQNIQNMIHQKSLYADAKDNEWSINEYQPWVRDYNQAQAMIGAGEQNFSQGINTVAQSGANYGSMGFGGAGGGSGGGTQTQAYGTGGNQMSTNPFSNRSNGSVNPMMNQNQNQNFQLKDPSLNMFG